MTESKCFDGAIGIDLGTTYSCVAVFANDQVEVIPNEQGNRTTPSCVAFQGDEVLVGESARNLAARGAKNVIYDAKRMIGRRFDDKELAEDARRWPFTTSSDTEGRICVSVEHKGETLLVAPELISSKVLAYLKHCAERYLGKTVSKAVVTVPAYFNDAQRESTRAAATIAGLEVLRMVNEPTAAALCYGLGTNAAVTAVSGHSAQKDGPMNVLVFDLGGGTFDVSIITIDSGIFSVRATAGDTHLGGQDIDHALVEHVLADLKSRYGISADDNARLLSKAKAVCEKVKRTLSFSTTEEVALEGVLPGGDDYVLSLSRAKLEELNAKLFAKCTSVVKQALKDAKMAEADIDQVVLVGGSSRIPKLQSALTEIFGAAKLCNTVHPDEAVAIGAAIQAAILSTDPTQQSKRTAAVALLDVVPLSIGVEVDDGKFDVVIPRNTTIPYLATKEYSTVEDNQEDVDITVYEGERRLTKFNHRLGGFSLEGITRAKQGEPTITVTFSVDADGLLTITGTEALAKKSKTLTVQSSERLSESQVANMIEVAKKFESKDELSIALEKQQRDITSALDELEDSVSAAGLELSAKLSKKLKFVPHARKWVAETLPQYESAEQSAEKMEKILLLIKKAQKRLRKESKGHTPASNKRAKTERGEQEDSNEDDDDEDGSADDDE